MTNFESNDPLEGVGVLGLSSSVGLQQQPLKPDAANLHGVLANLESVQQGHARASLGFPRAQPG